MLPSKTAQRGFVYGELAIKAEVSFSTSHCFQRVPHFISLRVKRTEHTPNDDNENVARAVGEDVSCVCLPAA